MPGGYGNITGEEGNTFSSTNQPDPEAKKAGWAKRLKGQELVKAILELAFKGLKDDQIKKAAAEYYGIQEEEITVEMMMHFKQAEKAIQNGDTSAYHAIMSRAFGLPKQKLEHTGEDGESIKTQITVISNVDYKQLSVDALKEIVKAKTSDE